MDLINLCLWRKYILAREQGYYFKEVNTTTFKNSSHHLKSMDENRNDWRKNIWTRLNDYLSRRALIREGFTSSIILSHIEGIELLANLSNIEECNGNEKSAFTEMVIDGKGFAAQEKGWNSDFLHNLAKWYRYDWSIRDGFKGEVGDLYVKDKTIKKNGKLLHKLDFVYPLDGVLSEGLIISRDRKVKGDFVIDRFRGVEDRNNSHLHLVTGYNKIISTLVERCGVYVDNPVGIFLFEDEKGNIYVNPAEYEAKMGFDEEETTNRGYPKYVEDLLKASKDRDGIYVSLYSGNKYHQEHAFIVGKLDGYSIDKIGTEVSRMKEYHGEEFLKKFDLQDYTDDKIRTVEVDKYVINRVLAAKEESLRIDVSSGEYEVSLLSEEGSSEDWITIEDWIKNEVGMFKEGLSDYLLDSQKFKLNPNYNYRIPGI